MRLPLLVTLLPLLLASLALAAPSSSPYAPSSFIRKDSIAIPAGWAKRAPATGNEVVHLHLGLAKRDQLGLEARLQQISDPDHADYGKWLSADDVAEYFSPSAETRSIVSRWLQAHGVEESHVTKRSDMGNSISFSVPLAQARAMLGDADFAYFQHRDSGEERFTATSYSLPREVAPHIDAVFGLANFARGASFRAPYKMVMDDDLEASSAAPSSCQFNLVTAQCLRDLYGTADYKPSGKGQFIGISGFLEEYANYDDLAQYEADQRPDAKGYKFSEVSINGGLNDQSKPGGEASLDVQTVAGIAYPINSTYYSTAGRPPFKADAFTPTNTNEPYEDELNYLIGLKKLPSVLSTSYGDDEQTVPLEYAKRICSDIAGLTARGVSMLYASGDNGVGDTASVCKSNDGKNTTMFLPTFPSTCPWVTSVGATMRFDPEVVTTKEASFIISGSGFSNYFPRPDYQKKAVAGYLAKIGNKHANLYNHTGRAYPDIAAQGSRFKIAVKGKFGAVSGTSASTPLFASIVALLNDARFKAGKPQLGFLNPLIYGLEGKGFNDITQGSATGCGTDGFPALEGWDPAVGYGTPQFDTLKKLVGA
ncbi:subtilisin-like protein [Jaminaea rosea]|uniref:tripeptidyl-peptidase II n=1 Tax=Jaminaea rosea TaxID=1569628 RepID=A0A316USV9_9BASI|nr:subtilisin-like protein [Jaminaea rosea]PWN28386.1 subtilisin-like protein [Jaminaea rosea]